MIGLTRGSAAIVGVAESDLGSVAEGMTPTDLMAQATARALHDCGLSLGEVDAVFAATSQLKSPTLQLCEYLGIHPKYQDSTNIGGTSFESHVAHAQAAIEAGLCEVAVIAYGSTQRLMGRSKVNPREFNPYESPYRPFLPASAYALAASRHMYEFGTTRRQLAEVAVAARQWALLNPVAWEKEPLSIDDVLNARMISHPFSVRDICLLSDGGGALVVVSEARAKALRKKPAYILGVGEYLSHGSISSMSDLIITPAAVSGPAAFRMAGLRPEDIKLLQLYDAFTLNPIMFLEDLGYCKKGEGGPFVEGGRIAPGGTLSVNTNGGGLSYCHPGMYGIFLLIEAVRQIRGERGAGQAKNNNLCLVHGNGMVYSAGATVILGDDSTV